MNWSKVGVGSDSVDQVVVSTFLFYYRSSLLGEDPDALMAVLKQTATHEVLQMIIGKPAIINIIVIAACE